MQVHNNNLYLKSHTYINNQLKVCRAFYCDYLRTYNTYIHTERAFYCDYLRTYNTYMYIHTELWKCDLLKAITDDTPDKDRTRDCDSPLHKSFRLKSCKTENSLHIETDIF